MQVGVLPAAPLPDSVKVARRFVKPLVLVRVQVWQPIWKAGRYKLAAPVSKTGSASPRSEHYRRLPPTINSWRFYGERLRNHSRRDTRDCFYRGTQFCPRGAAELKLSIRQATKT